MTSSISHNVTAFAATNLKVSFLFQGWNHPCQQEMRIIYVNVVKGTALPAPGVTAAPVVQAKTLPHALGRAAATASNALNTPQGEPRLGQALKEYALAYEKIGAARLDQDDGKSLVPLSTRVSY